MKTYKIITSVLQRLSWVPTRLIFNFFCNFKVAGIKNIRTKKNVIFACNHMGDLDPILIAAAIPFFSRHLPLFYTSREKDFYKKKCRFKRIIYGGKLFKTFGAYPVHVGLRNYEQALKTHHKILEDKGSVCIFPEGKKNLGDKTIKAKGGVSFLAHKSQLPIIPVLIQDAHLLTTNDFICRKRKIKVTFGKPLYIKDIFKNKEIILNDSQNDYEIIASIIMEKIIHLH